MFVRRSLHTCIRRCSALPAAASATASATASGALEETASASATAAATVAAAAPYRFVEFAFKGKREVGLCKAVVGTGNKRKCVISLPHGDELVVETSKLLFTVSNGAHLQDLGVYDFKSVASRAVASVLPDMTNRAHCQKVWSTLSAAFPSSSFAVSDAAAILFPGDAKEFDAEVCMYATYRILVELPEWFSAKRGTSSRYVCRSPEDVASIASRKKTQSQRKTNQLLACLRICNRLKAVCKTAVIPGDELMRSLEEHLSRTDPARYSAIRRNAATELVWNPAQDERTLRSLQLYGLFGHLTFAHNAHLSGPLVPVRLRSLSDAAGGDSYNLVELDEYFDDMQTIYEDVLRPLRRRGLPQDAYKLCVELGIMDPVTNFALYQTPLLLDFSTDELTTAQSMAAQVHVAVPAISQQVIDFGMMPAYAIDDSRTRDVDDAISVTDDNWIVVHIADPARWFDVAHPVHDIAFRRVSSVYLPERTIPMFPPALSENLFSLAASQTKPVLSFSVRLGEDGSIVESRISPGVVHNVVRLTYDEVDAMLENASGQADAPMSRSLQLLNTLAQRRAAYRKNKGAMAVDLPQCEPRVDTESGKISINIERSYRSLSHVLVQEWMVVAGELAAQFAHGNGIPIPYRTQQPSATPLPAALFSASTVIDTPSMRNFAAAQSTYSMDELSNIVKGSIAVRNMSPAVAQAEPGAHAGLGLACYAHTTSPIRRYGDLVVAAQVKAFLASAPLPFSRDTIAGLVCPQMERVSIHIAKLQRESQRFWALHYVDSLFRAAVPKKEKLVFNALITGLDASVQRGIYGADVMLLELGLRWKVDVSGDGFNVGDVLRVQVHEVFPDRAFLQLMPIT